MTSRTTKKTAAVRMTDVSARVSATRPINDTNDWQSLCHALSCVSTAMRQLQPMQLRDSWPCDRCGIVAREQPIAALNMVRAKLRVVHELSHRFDLRSLDHDPVLRTMVDEIDYYIAIEPAVRRFYMGRA